MITLIPTLNVNGATTVLGRPAAGYYTCYVDSTGQFHTIDHAGNDVALSGGETGQAFPDAPHNDTLYGRKNNDWVAVPLAPDDAPNDGKFYVRKNQQWVELPTSTPPTSGDAAAVPGLLHRYLAASFTSVKWSDTPASQTAALDATPSGAAAVGGSKCVTFSGGGRYLAEINQATPLTIVMSFICTGPANAALICFADGYNSGLRIDNAADGSLVVVIPNVGGYSLAGQPATRNAWHTFALVCQQGQSPSVYIDGLPIGYAAAAPPYLTSTSGEVGFPGSGYQNTFEGSVGEFIVYSQALDAPTLASISTYLLANQQ